jgi:hypothetical protein
MEIDIKDLPGWAVQPHTIGTWFPERGDYKEWRDSEVSRFGKDFVIVKEQTHSTYSGGIILVVEALRKSRAEEFETGRGCPECILVSIAPDDTAIHLIDSHGWGTDKASAWLREKVEARAFNDPE